MPLPPHSTLRQRAVRRHAPNTEVYAINSYETHLVVRRGLAILRLGRLRIHPAPREPRVRIHTPAAHTTRSIHRCANGG